MDSAQYPIEIQNILSNTHNNKENILNTNTHTQYLCSNTHNNTQNILRIQNNKRKVL